MLIENPTALIAACISAAAVSNLAILKLSPQIKDWTRYLVSGGGVTAASLAALIGPNDSVVATGTDLMVLGASFLGGLAAAIGSTRFVRPQGKLATSD